ncbi:MAG: hypothetical protein UT86_C0003G0065 [Candidatus Magasanikbacteria bacterium GW2011_GWC2_40_17]|uniref:Uncharacterized protein n=1 Tax=Candidatus Magasanikbacteria bacterium GW2011_GWA2_42_32 TaxID=1619039 RepID=A0A0G1D4K7_9BACT|nr:MAG: hypothetical protein UT86_C0003G0065 [Candidatus Magasanikbacteria bacterium GW2011_GWC2_40_17]KKS56968.1 MAG: hypothetical protein UV20_C0004G0064 [Candidatus Magasanikbacteria bacterium GW2011_GWA2_42_32]OGH85698.1 MAG: hypothetical protein A2294_03665 [Candidatus Magasanikbacteria bacterium RIFOXYB2_FULL_38_10]
MLDKPELNTFLIQPPARDRSQIIIFLGPAIHGGANKERIFILGEILSSNLDLKNKIQIFINQLAKKYQELERESPLIAFENTLEWGNNFLRENFDSQQLSTISILFGSLRNEQMQFAVGGRIGAHIFYKENDEYKNIDLIKNYSVENEGNVFFPNLVSGTIHHNNFTLFATPTTFNYLTTDRLQKIITGNKLEDICPRLETLLNEIENHAAFGGILLAWPENNETIERPSAFKLTPNESVRQLMTKQKETAQIMSPALFNSIKKYLRERKNKNSGTAKKEDTETIKKITKIYTRLTGWQGKLRNLVQKILTILGQTIYKFYLAFKKTIIFLLKIEWRTPNKAKETLNLGIKQTAAQIKIPFIYLVKKYLAIEIKKRILWTLCVIALIAVIINLSFNYHRQKTVQETASYMQIVTSIKEKIDEADSNLIYKNEDRAQELSKEAKELLTQLPAVTNNQRKTYSDLSNDLKQIIYKMQKIQTVVPQDELNLKALKMEKGPEAFFKTSTGFIFLAVNSPTLYIYNSATQKTKKIINDKLSDLIYAGVQKDNSILLVLKNNEIIQFDPDNETFSSSQIVLPNQSNQISLAATYNAKLYSLDIQNNQIFKHLPSTTGFGKGEEWLKKQTKVDFTGATSLMIDGNIYLSKNNGQIYKLENGVLQSFDLNLLDPVLSTATKIYTKNGSDNFFVLDQDKKRVIIWNKITNKLFSQLTAAEWDDLKDFSVDEKQKKIYLLNHDKIYSAKY